MSSLSEKFIDRALFISPIVNMETLISDMMGWAGVTENVLHAQGEVATDFGEIPVVGVSLLRAGAPACVGCTDLHFVRRKDNLASYETLAAFAQKSMRPITVMPSGEHWFHTEEQMSFLDEWVKGQCS